MELFLILKHLTASWYRDMILIWIQGDIKLPVLSIFYVIIIGMYFLQSKHNPPHIHAIYNNYSAAINLEGVILDGMLPPKALVLVQEWIGLNKNVLLEMWETQEFKKIPPLN